MWFLTIAFGVCLFYVFNSLETQAVFQYLGSGPQAPTAQAIRELIGMLSVFVWVVLAFLILYASGFLIRRRKESWAPTCCWAWSGGRWPACSCWKPCAWGCWPLLAGLGLGVLAAWGLSAFTAGLFAVPMTEFTFSVSLAAMGKRPWPSPLSSLLVMLCTPLPSRCRLLGSDAGPAGEPGAQGPRAWGVGGSLSGRGGAAGRRLRMLLTRACCGWTRCSG